MANEVEGYKLFEERERLCSANRSNNLRIDQLNVQIGKIMNDNYAAQTKEMAGRKAESAKTEAKQKRHKKAIKKRTSKRA